MWPDVSRCEWRHTHQWAETHWPVTTIPVVRRPEPCGSFMFFATMKMLLSDAGMFFLEPSLKSLVTKDCLENFGVGGSSRWMSGSPLLISE